MQVNRLMPTEEAHELIELTREICRKELAPRVDDAERERRFPAEAFTALGRAGLLSLPYPEEYGGAAQPYEVYLQVVEEIAATWMSVAVGVSVHALTCFPLAGYGTDAQRETFLPGMLSGEQLGGYALSEVAAGSDVASMTTRAREGADGGWVLRGTKAWISHAAHASYYTTFARTGAADSGSSGIESSHAMRWRPSAISNGRGWRQSPMRNWRIRYARQRRAFLS